AIPGVRFGEYLPDLAQRLDRLTLVRSMITTSPVHELAVHRLLGGVTDPPSGTGVAATRTDRPHLGALVAAARRPEPGRPPAVILPTRLTFEGTTFPGQNGGFLGARYDPWHLVGDPSHPDFAASVLNLPGEVSRGDSNVWDTHENNFGRLKGLLLPPFDQAVSALIDDLEGRGLWDDVLVIITGEFGRTPRVGQPIKGGAGAKPDGRDHWPGVF